jgi:uncharacterized membrane protein
MIPWMPFGCLPLVIVIGFLILFPLFLADLMASALGKLGLSPALSLFVVFAIFIGGLVNIPVKKVPRVLSMDSAPVGLYGMGRFFPALFRQNPYTVIAVNIGGCVIPCLIVVYELFRIAARGPMDLSLALLAVAVNTAVCYRLARPVPNVGIALPALVPAIVSAACAFLFVRDFAPPVAFTAGVLGTLIGADLLHLKHIGSISTGMASIGGAGTFDGIVLSGLIATLLA